MEEVNYKQKRHRYCDAFSINYFEAPASSVPGMGVEPTLPLLGTGF